MKSSRYLLAVFALLCGTALVQAADMSQAVYVDDSHPMFSLTGTVGGVAMDLPDGGGLFQGEGANDPNDWLLGGTVGLSATAGTGEVLGGLQGFIGINAFATYAYGNYNKTSNFTGNGIVVMQGGGGPFQSSIIIATTGSATGVGTGSILSTHSNGTGGGESADVSASSGASPGLDAAYASVAQTGNPSFQWGGVQARANSSRAFAALADEHGGVFIAAGNLDGLNLTQNYTTQAFYTGGDVTFGLSGQNGTTTLQGYVGPSYRYLWQRNSQNSDFTVDVPEYEDLVDFPLFSMTTNEEYSSHYVGGVAGLQATIPLSSTTAFTLGVEGGAYYTMASMTSDGSYHSEGGSQVGTGDILDPAVASFGPITVESGGDTYEADTIAFAARGTAAYTVAIAQNAQLTFSGSVDYLSAVATQAVNVTNISADNTDVTYASGGSNDRITWGQMINLSGSVSLTGQF